MSRPSVKNYKIFSSFLIGLVTFISCGTIKPETSSVSTKDIVVLGIHDKVPKDAQFKGKIKVGRFLPPFLTLYKNYDSLIAVAKERAAEEGGNILKITSHTPYQYNFGNKEITLHKIKANVYFGQIALKNKATVEIIPKNVAVLNFYMNYQGLVVRKLYIKNVMVSKLRSKAKYTYTVKDFGKVEVKCGKNGVSLELNVQPQKVYYLKCSNRMGWIKSTPFLELMDSLQGSKEFNSL